MTWTVFAVVLFAAALHASWNAIVKAGTDTMLTTALVTLSAATIAAVALPFLPQPAPESWPFIAISSVLQVVYYLLVAATYRSGDMSQTYPVMRGAAPLLVAIVSVTLLGHDLHPLALAGIAILCAGILGMAWGSHGSSKGIGFALLNALVIAVYTLVDGEGVRRSGAPAAYTLWILLLGLPMPLWIFARRWAAFRAYVARNWYLGIIGGFGTLASYGLALWAMTLAPVAMVAALRESSILFGIVISGLILKETLTPVRIAGAGVIALGVVVLRLA